MSCAGTTTTPPAESETLDPPTSQTRTYPDCACDVDADGYSTDACDYSPVACDTCNWAPCDGSC